MESKNKCKSVFITGASSGLGAALARRFAKEGHTVGIAARSGNKLKQLAAELAIDGAKIYVFELDVSDSAACEAAAQRFLNDAGPIDFVFANAGVGGWRNPVDANLKEWASMADINFKGVINTVMPFVPAMAQQRSGHIIAISSIAGLFPLPGGPYSASKAAVRFFMDGLRYDLKKFDIHVTTICPGFIDTEMLAGDKNYPFIIPVEKAVDNIVAAMRSDVETAIFPWQWRVAQTVLALLPKVVLDKVTKSVTKQK